MIEGEWNKDDFQFLSGFQQTDRWLFFEWEDAFQFLSGFQRAM